MKSSIKEQDMVVVHLELAKVYLKLDQPNAAREAYTKALLKHPGDINLILGTECCWPSNVVGLQMLQVCLQMVFAFN